MSNVKRSRLVMSVLVLGILLLTAFFLFNTKKSSDTTRPTHILIHEQSWQVIGIAENEETRRRGLSHREKLEPQTGLLFSFPEVGKYSFWMKDMRFPLDIIFIRPNGVVDSVASNRLPGDLTPVFPQEPILHVFEVNAGEAKDIQPGDKVEW